MKRILACVLPFLACSVLLGAEAQKRQARQSTDELRLLQKKMHAHLDRMRTELGPEGEALARHQLSKDLRELQARTLELRRVALKVGLSVPPAPWSNVPANARIDVLIHQTRLTLEDLMALFLKLNTGDPSADPGLQQMTSGIVSLLTKMEKGASEDSGSGMPDLIVCLKWDSSAPLIYQKKRIHVLVKNRGEGRAPASTLRVYVKQNGRHYIDVPALAPLRAFDWNQRFDWPTCGNKVVRARVNYHGKVAESIEDNNELERDVHVVCILPAEGPTNEYSCSGKDVR